MASANAHKPVRIGIDGRPLMHYEVRGFARYTIELFRAIKEIAGNGVELISFSPAPLAREFLDLLEVTPVVFRAAREILWEQVELPRQLQQNGIDLFHATANRGLPYRHACKYVITCHDVIDRLPEFADGESRRGRFRKAYADFAVRHSADKYITVSEFSKQDICRFHRVPPADVVVIYNGASSRFHESVSPECSRAVREKYRLPASYFLSLAGFDKRKNPAKLVEAYALLPKDAPQLVLAAEHKWQFDLVVQWIAALGLRDRVFCPGVIDDPDLPAIYQGALALVHPSRYEGFGLQLVEAMASGIPVLASATTSLPEVLGGCGLLFDPEDANSIAQQMLRVISDAGLRAELAQRGRQRARFFSWHKAAEQTLGLYCDLLGQERADVLNSGAAAQEQRG